MSADTKPRVAVTKDGPYIVTGGIPLVRLAGAPDGRSGEWQIEETSPPRASYALCRCGRSRMAPFCDYKHLSGRFDGSESAARTQLAGDDIPSGLPAGIGFARHSNGAMDGPLRLRGSIDVVSADAFTYATDDAVALCRCGTSRTKPFCDGSHARA